MILKRFSFSMTLVALIYATVPFPAFAIPGDVNGDGHITVQDAILITSLTDVFHVYYVDADIEEELIEVNEGQAFRYFAPAELGALAIPAHARAILEEFVVSPAYKGMFH